MVSKTVQLLVLVGAIAACSAWNWPWSGEGEPIKWSNLWSTFTKWHNLPKNVNDPIMKDYVEVPGPHKFDVKLYCLPNDPRVCMMFDVNGNMNGLQISYLLNDTTTKEKTLGDIYYSKIGMMSESNIFGAPAYAAQVFFADPEGENGPVRKNLDEVADGVWVNLGGKWVAIARDEAQAPAQGFTKQRCFPAMGMHYFYNMNKNQDCMKEPAVFGLYQKKQLVGFGMVAYGGFSKTNRDWFEAPSNTAIKIITSDRPACLTDLNTKYGVTSIHVYFTEKPWFNDCFSYLF